ncbi:hypothetical protein S245_005092, partial [Arachis hypogaea]
WLEGKILFSNQIFSKFSKSFQNQIFFKSIFQSNLFQNQFLSIFKKYLLSINDLIQHFKYVTFS